MSLDLAQRIREVANMVERLGEISAPLSRQDAAQRLADALGDLSFSVRIEYVPIPCDPDPTP